LPAGDYEIEVKPRWRDGDVRDYTLTIYAPKKITILSDVTNQPNELG